MKPVPIGVTGELCIAGDCVGAGYLNRPELTAEKFIDNPFGVGKLYKTGDLAYWRQDGNICYVGRKDNQIKLNGQRIEIGEIETVINSINSVEAVAVIVKKNDAIDTLVAFYTGESQIEAEILQYCRNKLPKYMIPSAIVHLDSLPLNQSGKLDRKALKNINVVFDNAIIKEEPVTETEKEICKLFEKTLHIDFVGKNENFFNLGGTSLHMISILSEEYLRDVTAAEFISHPTPEKLAALVDSQEDVETTYLYSLRKVRKSTKALILIPYAGGDASAYAAITKDFERFAPEISLYYVDYLHSYDECMLVADEIAKIAETKEIYVYSHCAGAAVALQIINILEEKSDFYEFFIWRTD
jgi:hypothetical protein